MSPHNNPKEQFHPHGSDEIPAQISDLHCFSETEGVVTTSKHPISTPIHINCSIDKFYMSIATSRYNYVPNMRLPIPQP
jgi:hypothetical protein